VRLCLLLLLRLLPFMVVSNSRDLQAKLFPSSDGDLGSQRRSRQLTMLVSMRIVRR